MKSYRFAKYHGLGNDYIVLEQADWPTLSPAEVRQICHRQRGVGSDGILWVNSEKRPFEVTIFNPDGSEAEKSGNGLRILSRYLFDGGLVQHDPFPVKTAGGMVTCRVVSATEIVVEMGKCTFMSGDLPATGPNREILREPLALSERSETVEIATVSIGNPHCVVLNRPASVTTAQALGPHIENHPLFPQRINVQFLEVIDRHRIRIEIWERGAGYTLASGSSSCAAAAVAVRLEYCLSPVTVEMPGGNLQVEIGPDYDIRMTGPAEPVMQGEMAAVLLS